MRKFSTCMMIFRGDIYFKYYHPSISICMNTIQLKLLLKFLHLISVINHYVVIQNKLLLCKTKCDKCFNNTLKISGCCLKSSIQSEMLGKQI